MQINLVLNRLMLYFQVNKKSELADKLGVGAPTISNWITRNTIDWQIVFTKCEGINLNWLVFGIGQMRIDQGDKTTDTSIYKELLLNRDKTITELNREIGKLEAEINRLNQYKPPDNLMAAAEPSTKYKGKKR